MLAAPQRFVDYYGSTGSLMNGIAGSPARTILVSVNGVEFPIFGAKRLKGGRLGDGVLVCISLRQLLRAAYTEPKILLPQKSRPRVIPNGRKASARLARFLFLRLMGGGVLGSVLRAKHLWFGKCNREPRRTVIPLN